MIVLPSLGRRAPGAFALALTLTSCGGVRVADRPLPPDLAWPAGDPRVRLERVLALEAGSSILTVLSGRREEALTFERPYGVAWDGGDLLVADPGARRVVRVADGGRVSVSPEGAAGAPVALAACGSGVVASDPEQGRVVRLDRDLRRVAVLADGLQRPTGLACRDGRVYVAETGAHRITLLEPDGTHRSFGGRGAEPGRFNFPTALALAGDELLVGDTLNFRVQRLDGETGAARGIFGRLGDAAGEMPRIKGVAVDARGQVWVTDALTSRVSLYNADGDLLLALGGEGMVPGRFSFPAGVAAHPDGRVAVADSFNRRIQVFRVLQREGKAP